MENITNICFLWEDFLIQNKEKLNYDEYSSFENGKEYNDFNTAKECFKQNIYTILSLSDTQEVWPEILEKLENIKQEKKTKYKVWCTPKIIGFSSYK